jgi:hypothetical protein
MSADSVTLTLVLPLTTRGAQLGSSSLHRLRQESPALFSTIPFHVPELAAKHLSPSQHRSQVRPNMHNNILLPRSHNPSDDPRPVLSLCYLIHNYNHNHSILPAGWKGRRYLLISDVLEAKYIPVCQAMGEVTFPDLHNYIVSHDTPRQQLLRTNGGATEQPG